MGEGKHVKIVGIGDPDLLGNKERVESFLRDTVQKLGMRLLSGPHTCDVKIDIEKLQVEPFEDEGGITGIVVLSTSHLSIHTWPLRKWFVMDAYSCRDFNEGSLLRFIEETFQAGKMRLTDLSFSLDLGPDR